MKPKSGKSEDTRQLSPIFWQKINSGRSFIEKMWQKRSKNRKRAKNLEKILPKIEKERRIWRKFCQKSKKSERSGENSIVFWVVRSFLKETFDKNSKKHKVFKEELEDTKKIQNLRRFRRWRDREKTQRAPAQSENWKILRKKRKI